MSGLSPPSFLPMRALLMMSRVELGPEKSQELWNRLRSYLRSLNEPSAIFAKSQHAVFIQGP